MDKSDAVLGALVKEVQAVTAAVGGASPGARLEAVGPAGSRSAAAAVLEQQRNSSGHGHGHGHHGNG